MNGKEQDRPLIGLDEIYCPSCSEIIKRGASVCRYCNVPVAKAFAENTRQGKSKGTAIVLAFFFGCWTWLYTVQQDWWKFLVATLLGTFGMVLCWLALAPWTDFLAGFILVGCWVGPILDAGMKSQEFYLAYPYKGEPAM